MEITIGDEIHGLDGALGTVDRFLIDPRTDTVEHIVVKPGMFHDSRIIPIDRIHSLPDGRVGVDLDADAFKALEVYSEDVFHAGYRHDSGPPAYGPDATSRMDYQLDETVSMGTAAFNTGKPMGYPGGEQTVPDDKQFPSVTKGTDIVDVNGEKVGDIGSFTVDVARGIPTRLTMHRGLIFGSERQIPIDWFDRVLPGRVLLRVTNDEIEHLTDAA